MAEMLFVAPVTLVVPCLCSWAALKGAMREAWQKVKAVSLYIYTVFTYSSHFTKEGFD